MLNALNEVLRDDYIKDSVGGVGRWNKVIEKAGLAFRLQVPHKAFNRQHRHARRHARVAGRARRRRSRTWQAGAREWLPTDEDRAFVASLMGRVVEPGKFANWIAPPAMRHQPPAGRFRVRPLQLTSRGFAAAPPHGRIRARTDVIRQHLIDPEICIRCNTCEETCPVDAITHDARNYVVAPTSATAASPASRRARPARSTTGASCRGARVRDRGAADWDVLPPEQASCRRRRRRQLRRPPRRCRRRARRASRAASPTARPARRSRRRGRPRIRYVNLYTQREPGHRDGRRQLPLTDGDVESDTHHIVLDFGATPFPVLEGQSIGIVPPGVDANGGRTHVARQYSIASPRDGERRGYNNVSLTVKRVTADHEGASGARRLLELPVRSREGRHGAGRSGRSATPS